MMDAFLEVAYKTQQRKQAHYELVGLMEGLPVVELKKLASGVPVSELYGHLDKTAYLNECGPDGAPKTFLEKFQGTPLFDQALALEQQELQAEMTDIQKRQERRQQNAADDSVYEAKDRIRLQKRLLELELSKQQLGAPAPGATPAQGAGAPGEVPPEGVEAGAGGVVGKMASAKVAEADAFGRELARADAAKIAQAERVRGLLAKTANPLAAMGSAVKGLAGAGGGVGKALSFAAKNPGLVGAGLGAAGGAVAGGPGHRLEGAMGGAALGGMAGGVGGRMMAGQGLGAATANTARAGLNTAMRGTNVLANKLPGQLSTPVTGFVQKANQLGHDAITGLGGA